MELAVRSRHRVQLDIKRHGNILPRLLHEHADEVVIKESVRTRVLVQVESVYVVRQVEELFSEDVQERTHTHVPTTTHFLFGKSEF